MDDPTCDSLQVQQKQLKESIGPVGTGHIERGHTSKARKIVVSTVYAKTQAHTQALLCWVMQVVEGCCSTATSYSLEDAPNLPKYLPKALKHVTRHAASRPV